MREMFTTERLRVRRMAPADLDFMCAVYGDAEAMRYVGEGDAMGREEGERWVEVTLENYAKRGYGMSVVERIEGSVPIGFCGLVHPGGQVEPEIKYAFLREHWGQGHATECVRAMLAHGAAEHALTGIIATVDPDNAASLRVLAKAGMTVGEPRFEEDGTRVEVLVWTAPG